MTRTVEAAKLAGEIRARLAELPTANTAAVRVVRRDVSRQVRFKPPDVVMETALLLLREESDVLSFFADELLSCHRFALQSLDIESLVKLGSKMNSWVSVDSFALLLAGPTWLEGRVADSDVHAWARNRNLWWRRAALVSTIALSRNGHAEDVRRVLAICRLLMTDREDMVVKALSWALRELAKKHPEEVQRFVDKHEEVLASRVIREVGNKLRTGLKTPRGLSSGPVA